MRASVKILSFRFVLLLDFAEEFEDDENEEDGAFRYFSHRLRRLLRRPPLPAVQEFSAAQSRAPFVRHEHAKDIFEDSLGPVAVSRRAPFGVEASYPFRFGFALLRCGR